MTLSRVLSGRADVLAGYYGFHNFGDDLFREVLTTALAAEDWARPIVSNAGDGRLDKLTRNVYAVRNLGRARSLTLGGGSILGARPPLSMRHLEMVASARGRISYCAIGVGVMEGKSIPPNRIIAQMSWVGLRSYSEYQELAAAHPQVTYSSDIAYAARRLLPVDPMGVGSNIVVIPAAIGELGRRAHDAAFLSDWLSTSVVNQASPSETVTVVLMQPSNAEDSAICAKVASALRQHGLSVTTVAHRDPRETLAIIAASRLVLSDRLHGAIAAHIYDVPFRLSKHHKKCIDFLTDIGHPDSGEEVSYVGPDAQGRLETVSAWAQTQGPHRQAHEDISTNAIEAWIAHLRQRSL
ncbi:polysaccharide pyruvyl transferase family protein [Microbacterium sp. Sa4CUA7]|uniref:Polysaccharide pyruvyl transferase family protein n=1 Tax=Microbacterium pullorum TaxID=2762236 RepID=A0ABR8S530_9MICO|nr:polysaccharide pyruvyl transferase family protein [Microbacterium pullorum]MBD7958582.1 polysaccharide pyruvyl transferase family protein [Microbacterium pullorum]